MQELIGPASLVLATVRHLLETRFKEKVAILLDGDPGVGKTAICDIVALDLAGTPHAVERVNGQSLTVDLVRNWAQNGMYGNLFSPWTVKRIDEIDKASPAGVSEMLTFLDYQPRKFAVLATTNEFAKLREANKGRLESRFIRFRVDAPSVEETAAFLRRVHGVPAATALTIAKWSVPEGCLSGVGCNVRSAINDSFAFLAAAGAQKGVK